MFNIEKSTIILLVIIASGIITSIPFVESAIPPTVAYKTISVNGTQLEAFTYNDILTLSSDGSISFDAVNADTSSQDPNFPAWDYRKTITIDNTLVDSDLTGFPVLISFTDTDLRDNALSNGDDILFADVTGTQLDHEFEMYDGTTGQMIAWVKADLTDTVDTVIYMYYGNSASSNQENIEAVWDDNYVQVWHLHDDLLDSTSNNIDAINSGSIDAVGLIGDGQEFDGISDYLYASVTGGDIVNAYPFTMSMIVEPDAFGNKSWFGLFDKSSNGVYFHTEDRTSPSTIRSVARNTSHTPTSPTDTINPSGVNWYHVAVVHTNATHRELWTNAVLQDTDNTNVNFPTGLLDRSTAGRLDRASHGSSADGRIDEVRVANVALSSSWLITEYNNQSDPSLFYSVGSEELFGVTDEIIFSVVGGSGGSVLDATTPRMIKHSVQPIDSQSFEITGLPIFDFLNIQGLITLNGSTSTKIEMEFNNDTGSNYSRGSVGNSNDIQVSFSSSSKDRKFYQEWHNMNSKTGYQRVIVFDNGTANFHSGLAFEAVSYNGTDRIESIKLRSQSGVSVIESGSWVNVIGWNSTE